MRKRGKKCQDFAICSEVSQIFTHFTLSQLRETSCHHVFAKCGEPCFQYSLLYHHFYGWCQRKMRPDCEWVLWEIFLLYLGSWICCFVHSHSIPFTPLQIFFKRSFFCKIYYLKTLKKNVMSQSFFFFSSSTSGKTLI